MKKSVGLLIIAFILFSCKTEQSNLKSDLALANLKGNVWKIDKTVHETGSACGCVLKTECNQSKYVYDEKGNLSELLTIDENGVVNDSSKYLYSRKGLCSEIEKFSKAIPAGKEVAVIQGGKLAGYKIYNENGELEATLTYIYSGDDITLEKTTDSKGEVLSSVEKEYINGQLVLQTEKDSKGDVKSTLRFTRNEKNDIIEYLIVTSKDNKEYKFTYEYEYDSTGNWTKQTRFYQGQIENIVLRNIEYFKV
jgi:hypothetical protein